MLNPPVHDTSALTKSAAPAGPARGRAGAPALFRPGSARPVGAGRVRGHAAETGRSYGPAWADPAEASLLPGWLFAWLQKARLSRRIRRISAANVRPADLTDLLTEVTERHRAMPFAALSGICERCEAAMKTGAGSDRQPLLNALLQRSRDAIRSRRRFG